MSTREAEIAARLHNRQAGQDPNPYDSLWSNGAGQQPTPARNPATEYFEKYGEQPTRPAPISDDSLDALWGNAAPRPAPPSTGAALMRASSPSPVRSMAEEASERVRQMVEERKAWWWYGGKPPVPLPPPNTPIPGRPTYNAAAHTVRGAIRQEDNFLTKFLAPVTSWGTHRALHAVFDPANVYMDKQHPPFYRPEFGPPSPEVPPLLKSLRESPNLELTRRSWRKLLTGDERPIGDQLGWKEERERLRSGRR
jgi:hypothetical protein